MQVGASALDLAIKLLNTLGLGALATGAFILFRSLQSRNGILEQNFNDLRSNYQEIQSAWKQQREETNARFEQETQFRTLWKATLLDSEDHKEKIKAWRDEQVVVLEKTVADLKLRITNLETDLKDLRSENNSLKRQSKKVTEEYRKLESEFRDTQSNNRLLSREIARYKGTGLQ